MTRKYYHTAPNLGTYHVHNFCPDLSIIYFIIYSLLKNTLNQLPFHFLILFSGINQGFEDSTYVF